MPEAVTPVQVGQQAPQVELETFDPSTVKFGKFRLADQIAQKKWTVLFFYPADFTFV